MSGDAALVALAAQSRGGVAAVGDQHSALAGRQLLVGVEAEGGEVAARPDPPAVRVDRPERLAGVLEDPEAVLRRGSLELGHRRRRAEDVDREDPDRALADGGGRGIRIDVERLGLDVAEGGPDPLVEEAVGGGDEAQRAGQDLVALAPAERPDPEVKGGRPARDRDRVPDPEPLGEPALEALDHRAQREPARAQDLEHQLLLARVDLRAGERDRVGFRPFAHSWKAYSSESTSASQEASMMFSETPIVPHSRSPSEESSRTRVMAPVPWLSSRIRTL